MLQVDVIFMLRGYMHMLTQSEFHCLLVSTHATIAGFELGIANPAKNAVIIRPGIFVYMFQK